VIFLYEQNSGGTPNTQSVELIEIMIMVLMILAVSIYSLVIMFPKIFLRKENLIKLLTSQELFQKNQGINDPAAHLIGVDRTLMIIRLAMTEGITLFGLVILLLSVQNGAIYTNDLYWLLSLPWLIQLFFTVNNYLSKEKAVERIYNEILPGVIT
jgi:F0F1-type ATP synthase membrane subunit c/vacuolar-type H+-ATPase subunit K